MAFEIILKLLNTLPWIIDDGDVYGDDDGDDDDGDDFNDDNDADDDVNSDDDDEDDDDDDDDDNQHVKYEKLLSTWSCWIDPAAANHPDSVPDTLEERGRSAVNSPDISRYI